MFENRFDAGRQLAQLLLKYRGSDSMVFALPRGGVVTGFEVATELHIPLDVVISRKLGAPDNAEFGIGAISENETLFLDSDTVNLLGLSSQAIEKIKQKEQLELERRVKQYRGHVLPDLSNIRVLLVDDGLATGVTAIAAIEALKKQRAKEIIFASPICAYQSIKLVEEHADKVVCLHEPFGLQAIGLYYSDFEQVDDQLVLDLLQKARETYVKYEGHKGGNHYAL